MASSTFNKILRKNLTRKEFLVFVGVFLFSLTGIRSLLESVKILDKDTSAEQQKRFGNGAYGE